MKLADILGYISSTKIFGIIPLDAIAHFLLGALLTRIGIKFKIKMKYIFIIIAIPTLLKEYHDIHVLNYPIYEPFKDIFVTYIPFIFVLFFRKLRCGTNNR